MNLLALIKFLLIIFSAFAFSKLNDKKEELLRTMISHEEIKKKIEDMKVQVEQYQQNVNEIRKKQGDLNQSWAKKCEPVEK